MDERTRQIDLSGVNAFAIRTIALGVPRAIIVYSQFTGPIEKGAEIFSAPFIPATSRNFTARSRPSVALTGSSALLYPGSCRLR